MKQEIAKREWEKHFGDDRQYLDKYFATYYSPQNLIINTENPNDDFIYMSLIVKYTYKYYNNNLPIGYVTAVLTNPEFRNKGYFRVAMQKVFDTLVSEAYILSCLIPASEELRKTYLRYGYVDCFTGTQNPDHNKSIVHQNKTIELYKELNYDLTTLKPNLNGMMRIIDSEKCLTIYAKNNPELSKTYKITDAQIEKNNKIIEINIGKTRILENSDKIEEITISELTNLMFEDSYMDLMFDQ